MEEEEINRIKKEERLADVEWIWKVQSPNSMPVEQDGAARGGIGAACKGERQRNTIKKIVFIFF